MSEAILELLKRYVKDHPSEADDFVVDGHWKQLTWRFVSEVLWDVYTFRQALQEHMFTYHFGHLPPQIRGGGMKHFGRHNAAWKQWEPDTEPAADVRAARAAKLNVATYYRTGPKRAGEAAERGESQQPPEEQPGGTQEDAFATQPRAAALRPAGGTRHATGIAEAVKRRRTMDPSCRGLAPGKTPRLLPAAPAIVKTEVPTPQPAHVINAAAVKAAAAAAAGGQGRAALAGGGSGGGNGARAPSAAGPDCPPLKDRNNLLPAAGRRTSAAPPGPGGAKAPAPKDAGATGAAALTSAASPSLLHWSTGHGAANAVTAAAAAGGAPSVAPGPTGSGNGSGSGTSQPPAQHAPPSLDLCRIPLAGSEGPAAAGPSGGRRGGMAGTGGGSAAPGGAAGAKAGPSGALTTVAPAAQLAALALPGGSRYDVEQRVQQLKADLDDFLNQARQVQADRAEAAALRRELQAKAADLAAAQAALAAAHTAAETARRAVEEASAASQRELQQARAEAAAAERQRRAEAGAMARQHAEALAAAQGKAERERRAKEALEQQVKEAQAAVDEELRKRERAEAELRSIRGALAQAVQVAGLGGAA
ncbi:hypothetical protein HYH03_015835 [Edaphochlamys debaryana]|uniref:Uncharacterized protein n=1 Tax=Edaphochlamys debaryana TaxID=47281 RepID=A0A836BS84_9CHLO|nr:hypothetical protein HYH03_015835 [Edaphochlamys debaryana]|eukprot:KAG2485458.1 hypothetical protein HYH03_015835 [Edaphochlamys debaryana]